MAPHSWTSTVSPGGREVAEARAAPFLLRIPSGPSPSLGLEWSHWASLACRW